MQIPYSKDVFAKVSSHSVAYLRSPTIIFHRPGIFYAGEVQFMILLLLRIMFLMPGLRKVCLTEVTKIPLQLLEVSQFHVLCVSLCCIWSLERDIDIPCFRIIC